MNKTIHMIWLGILCLLFPQAVSALPTESLNGKDTIESIPIPNSYKRLIDPLLDQDFHSLQKKVADGHMQTFTKLHFIELFYDGIEKANMFFSQEYDSKHARKKYEKGVKKIWALHNRLAESHPIEAYVLNPKTDQTQENWPQADNSIFEKFSGEWHGIWRSEQVDHYWLPTHELPEYASFTEAEISILAFQSVFTGDGIGWNYLIQKEGRNFILGFVGHFNETGMIDMERPHIGIPQPNGAILWKTKDHMYLEFVCHHHSCHIGPEHYVITGISFHPKRRNLKLIEAFQAVYTRDKLLRPDWMLLTKE